MSVVEIERPKLVLNGLAAVGHEVVVVLRNCDALLLLRGQVLHVLSFGYVARVYYLVVVQMLEPQVAHRHRRVLWLLFGGEHVLAVELEGGAPVDEFLQVGLGRVAVRPRRHPLPK